MLAGSVLDDQDPLYTLGLIHTVLDDTRRQLGDDIVVLSLS
jgi:hypothetical protein